MTKGAPWVVVKVAELPGFAMTSLSCELAVANSAPSWFRAEKYSARGDATEAAVHVRMRSAVTSRKARVISPLGIELAGVGSAPIRIPPTTFEAISLLAENRTTCARTATAPEENPLCAGSYIGGTIAPTARPDA